VNKEVLTDELTSYVQVGRRFQRAVNLERDFGQAHTLQGYQVTPAVVHALQLIRSGLGKGSTSRAWSLIGPYGSGKSAFAVFLSELLAPRGNANRTVARKLSRLAGAEFGRDIALNPVVLTGERAPLDTMLLRALYGEVKRVAETRPGKDPKLVRTLKRFANGTKASARRCETHDVVQCFEEAADYFQHCTQAGLFLVVDEAGKLLEYAAQQPARSDVYLLQALAESASRSNGAAFGILTILHQSFEQYADRLSTSQRHEWRKVQGRFGDLPFREGIDQIIGLTASALEPVGQRPPLTGWTTAVTRTREWVYEGTGWDRSQLKKGLEGCWPLHPTTAVLLGPLFKGHLAQNERSLFAFLSAPEPFSFREFLRTGQRSALYRVDQLYDYAVATLGNRLFGQENRGWSEISAALDRLPVGAGDVDARVLKTIGLLTILGDQVGLRASSEIISEALSDAEGVDKCLKRLCKQSRIVYRTFKDAYQIWEGSDLDLDQLVSQAADQVSPTGDLASLMQDIVKQRPIVARRHLFATGTLRYFEVRFIEVATLLSGVLLEPEEAADGLVVLALPRNAEEVSRLVKVLSKASRTWMSAGGGRPSLIGIPLAVESAKALALELYALEQVRENTPLLQADPVAKRELSARVDGIRGRLEVEVARTFHPGACRWFSGEGGSIQVGSARTLSRTVSDFCDSAYHGAPEIHNELLNRRKLSTTAAKARTDLLEAMVLHPEKEQLGLTAYPPEVSMYRSVLAKLKWHRRAGESWRFVSPKGASEIAECIDDFFENTEKGPQSLTSLYERLRQPPFGLKEGIIPVVVCASLMTRQENIAIYENGTFVPDLTRPLLERLLRSEEEFMVRQCHLTRGRKAVLEQLSVGLKSDTMDKVPVLAVVRRLMRVVAALPAYSRRTTKLSDTAVQVREELLKARDPAQLLFTDLPKACGVAHFKKDGSIGPKGAKSFVTSLSGALAELQQAYIPTLLDRILDTLADAIGLPRSSEAFRAELARRAERLLKYAGDNQLKAFLIRASNRDMAQDQWVESLAAQLVSKPPIEWVDGDEDHFHVQLALTSRRLRNLETLLVDKDDGDDGDRMRLLVARQGQPEQERVVTLREGERTAVDGMRDALLKTINKKGGRGLSQDALVAALGLAVDQILAIPGEGGKGGDEK
jgi:hypothetical protein